MTGSLPSVSQGLTLHCITLHYIDVPTARDVKKAAREGRGVVPACLPNWLLRINEYIATHCIGKQATVQSDPAQYTNVFPILFLPATRSFPLSLYLVNQDKNGKTTLGVKIWYPCDRAVRFKVSVGVSNLSLYTA